MQIRAHSINKITDQLGRIKNHISLSNSIRLFDLNILSEQFFKDLLNKVYGYGLENLNENNPFTESIDLGDKTRRIAFQVTSDKSKKKINDTVCSFYENGLNNDYQTLNIFLLGDKPSRSGQLIHGEFIFNLKDNIIDFSDILKSIQKLETSKICEIEQWIESELSSNKFGSHTPPSNKDFDHFFNRFLNNDVDAGALLFKAQPSLADCREVFSDEYYLSIHQIYSVFYFSMLEKRNTTDQLCDKDVYQVKAVASFKDLEDGKHNLPTGMSTIMKRKAFRPGKFKYYSISFLTKEQQHSISFNIWVFLNGRWVFFPKPWELVRGIDELKNHRGMKALVKIMKFLGLRLQKPTDQAGVFSTIVLINEFSRD